MVITYEPIDLVMANACLLAWDHRMGPLLRGNQRGMHHGLFHDGQPVAVTMTSTLIRERVGGVEGNRYRRRRKAAAPTAPTVPPIDPAPAGFAVSGTD